MKPKTEEKSLRIKDPRKITGKASTPINAAKEVCAAWGIPANKDGIASASGYLVALGYGKLRATTKWARDHVEKAKSKRPKARKPARKPARKARKAPPVPAQAIAGAGA